MESWRKMSSAVLVVMMFIGFSNAFPYQLFHQDLVVGGDAGWRVGYDYKSWGNEVPVRVGDILAHRYPAQLLQASLCSFYSNTVHVESEQFIESCTQPSDLKLHFVMLMLRIGMNCQNLLTLVRLCLHLYDAHAEFRYTIGEHTLTLLKSREAFDKCDMSDPVEEYEDGDTRIELTKPGWMYFVDAYGDHCDIGVKMAIKVAP
ncbi:hypothetical protein AXG93_1278s1090 [Marchantia polymorpha subsp. ruderalis]|uniref:Phytocyanin domain-containing protein n=1 Tax=Marchantia polymorpha subsp. ruderalis TaxID=1480154 RepID=A0A176WTU0_MARPO|nr:hypothetical protein AXG93_1278s1090 [Marchantia polymorpha subsp. ruderalis]